MKNVNDMDYIHVVGAREKNLKNIEVRIPKNKITVFTGVSGSGKSSLLFDTIAAESQRQLNETYSSFIRHRLPHYGQPKVESIENLSVAIIVDQKRIGGNARSTVGTITDIYSILRLLYSRIGKPFVGYSEVFSFNNPKGMCPKCEGIGKIDSIKIEQILDKDKSLNEGAIQFPTFEPGGWRIKRYLYSGFFDNDKKIRDYTTEEMEMLLYKSNIKVETKDPNWPKTSLYEGLIPRIERSFLKKEDGEVLKYKKEIAQMIGKENCPLCGGKRLAQSVLECKIQGKSIADCVNMSITDLLEFVSSIKESKAETMIEALKMRLNQMQSIGLGYLSLNRETSTLSGGESQRIKMVRQLGSSLTGLTYIFDEPSIGLHPHDVDKINSFIKLLKEKGNTVLIVEHDPDVIKIADHIIEMGPQAGVHGGRIMYEGSYEGLKDSDTLTGKSIRKRVLIKEDTRKPKGFLTLKNAHLHNLKQIDVNIPKGVLTVVTGVAGSGKSTLINQVLPATYPDFICIDQKAILTSKRSNIATFTGIFDVIRELFAKKNHVSASLFSFNAKGACPNCKGLGVTYTDLAFMDTIQTVCEECQGKRFIDEVLEYTLQDKSIHDILEMTVEEALAFFSEESIVSILKNISEVGLPYVTLGQPLNTLSGGELQRMKLGLELSKGGNRYVLDEPTTGLHMSDIAKFMSVLNKLVDQGSTVLVIEHNLDVISQADWIIDLGPLAGEAGGEIMYEGTPKEFLCCKNSLTAQHLNQYRKESENNWQNKN